MSETKYFGVVVRSDLLFLLSNSVGDALSLKKKMVLLMGENQKVLTGRKIIMCLLVCLFVCLSVCLWLCLIVCDCERFD